MVTIGERGAGKSHILGALYHAVNDRPSTGAWLKRWATTLNNPKIESIGLRENTDVIAVSLQRQRFKYLWDVLFEQHPHGTYVEGMWNGMGDKKTYVPPHDLMVEMFAHTPTMLLLDEYQTWFDGLKDTKQEPTRVWAFNFIQILAEIAKEHPELLVLVVSVRNGATDAYQQIHRVNPVQVDFRGGGSAEKIQNDRRRMLLHRLFENRPQIAQSEVEEHVSTHVTEHFRLSDTPGTEQERKRREFMETWPFAPHLLQLLEDQVLIAVDAQETRDLIRILANLFRSRGDNAPLLTAADFHLEDERSEIGALLDSVANEHHRTLREKAVRNLKSVMEAVPNHEAEVPHLREIVGALWLRSITVGNLSGAEPAMLQADITREEAVDDNAFAAELATIVENSFNIHDEGGRLVFKQEENPRAKVMASARNDRLFADGSDLEQLAKEVRYVIGGSDETARTSRVIALPADWKRDPWGHRRRERDATEVGSAAPQRGVAGRTRTPERGPREMAENPPPGAPQHSALPHSEKREHEHVPGSGPRDTRAGGDESGRVERPRPGVSETTIGVPACAARCPEEAVQPVLHTAQMELHGPEQLRVRNCHARRAWGQDSRSNRRDRGNKPLHSGGLRGFRT